LIAANIPDIAESNAVNIPVGMITLRNLL